MRCISLFVLVSCLCLAPSAAKENSVSEIPKISILNIILDLMQPKSLSKTMPTLVTFLPNLLGGVLTNILELVIEYGKRFVDWAQPTARILEVSARSLSESFLGRLLHWDFLDTGLRLMRVRRDCRSKAACECGAYLLHRNSRVAGFLKAMRSHLTHVTTHWPAMMNGLQGGVCRESYPECRQNFAMV